MVPKDVKKTIIITKCELFDWIVMPFDFKNTTSIFIHIMTGIFLRFGGVFKGVSGWPKNPHFLLAKTCQSHKHGFSMARGS